MGLVATRHVGFSPIKDRNSVFCIGRWILYYWVTREAQFFLLIVVIISNMVTRHDYISDALLGNCLVLFNSPQPNSDHPVLQMGILLWSPFHRWENLRLREVICWRSFTFNLTFLFWDNWSFTRSPKKYYRKTLNALYLVSPMGTSCKTIVQYIQCTRPG